MTAFDDAMDGIPEVSHPQSDALRAPSSVAQLTREHFGEWIDIPDRQAGGYLYAVLDEFHDGYPGRRLVLVHDDGTAEELEFTDSDPAGYPKTMCTPCSIRAALAPQPADAEGIWLW